MKKAIKQLVAVVIILMTSTNIIMAQDNDLEIIQSEIKNYNSKCPIEVSKGIFITKVKLEDQYMHYYSNIIPQENDSTAFQRLKENPQNQKELLLAFLSTQKTNIAYNYFKKHQIGIKYTYINNGDESTTIDVVITPEEVIAALGQQLPAHSMLEKMVENERAVLPLDTGYGMTETDIKLTDEYIMMYYTIDENKANMARSKAMLNNPEYKKLVINVLISSPSTKMMIDYMVQDNKGLGMVYTGNKSQDIIQCLISSDEIKEIIESQD